MKMVMYKPNTSIYSGRGWYKAHIYRLGDKLVARRDGALHVIKVVGWGEEKWVETGEIVEGSKKQ